MFRNLLWSAAPIALLFGSVAHAQTVAQASPPEAADTSYGSDVVVVTASRRDENIREVPIALSAYSGDKLAEDHVLSLVDLIPSSPNIQLAALQTNMDIHIRGIGNNLLNAGGEPGVAFHQDGVYLAESGLATSAFLDINRVEIMRGPQGTLFGRNATGGAVNVITNLPTRDLSYGVDASIGLDPVADHVAGFVSGPLTADGTLLGRVAVQQTYNEGFTKNLTPGGPERFDGANNYSGRTQLMWEPSDDFDARLSVEYQKEDHNGPSVFALGSADPTFVLPPGHQGASPENFDNRETYAHVGAKKFEGFGATLLTRWSVAGGDLKATIAYNRSTLFFNGDSGTIDVFTPIATKQNSSQEFAELLYASNPLEPFTFVIGANYVSSEQFQNKNVSVPFLPIPISLGGTINTDSSAIFVHGQYAFDSGLKIFAGARQSYDKKQIDEFLIPFVPAPLAQSQSWEQPTFEVGASYDFSPSVSGYLKYATGYKSGGFSAGSLTPAFDPETNGLVEAGLKGSYFDGAFQANLAVFHTSYEDLQVNQVRQLIVETTNAAQATVNGIELETVTHVTPSLRLELSAGYLDAKFDEFVTEDAARPTLGQLNLDGFTLPQAPELTLSAGGYYDILTGDSGNVTAGVQYDWKSRVYFSEFNIPIASQDSVGRLNLTLKYEGPDQTWSVGAYARNVTDEVVKNSAVVTSALVESLVLGYLDPGREVGLSFHYKN